MKNKNYQRFRTFVVYEGERLPLTVACERKGITRNSLNWWKSRGMSVQEAFDAVVPYHMRQSNNWSGDRAWQTVKS